MGNHCKFNELMGGEYFFYEDIRYFKFNSTIGITFDGKPVRKCFNPDEVVIPVEFDTFRSDLTFRST